MISTQMLVSPTSYIREDDGAEMVKVAPHSYTSRRALAQLCNPTRASSPRKPGRVAVSIVDLLSFS